MNNLIEKARGLKYSSLDYVDIEDIKASKIFNNDDSNIFLYQNSNIKKELYWESKSNHSFQLFWAANSRESFLEGLAQTIEYIKKTELNPDKIYIEFIPEEFLDDMNNMGFSIVSEWVDFWNSDLKSVDIAYKNKISIREVVEKDIKAVSEVTKSCTGYSRGFTGQSEDIIKEWMDTENSYLFVAEVDGTIVGLCFVILYGFDSEKGTILWIRELVVNPKFQSNGIGRRLIIHGINWGVENGAKRSFLACDVENYKAIRLYENLGYKKKEERGQINMELII